jgi:DNA-binding NarL/FixJ family response regulator
MIKVLLADDQNLVRLGFRAMLNLADDIEVVGEAATGEEAIRLARETAADVVLMDIRMPVLDGLAATRCIVADEDLAGVKVIILTTYETDEYIFEALRIGASGFILKDTEFEDLAWAIRVVHRGDALLSPRVTRRVIADIAARPERRAVPPDVLSVLTEREREVMGLVARGWSNDDIASWLFVSPATAKTHIGRAMAKLRVHDRAQLVVMAYETGLVKPGDASELPQKA